MLTDILKRQAPGVIAGPVDPFPIVAVNGILENSQEQGPLGVQETWFEIVIKDVGIGAIGMKELIGVAIKRSHITLFDGFGHDDKID